LALAEGNHISDHLPLAEGYHISDWPALPGFIAGRGIFKGPIQPASLGFDTEAAEGFDH
jgi:hypothetical protein